MKQPLALFAVAGVLALASATGYAQESEQYVPLLPKVQERRLPIDKAKGYLVKEIKPEVYVITDGGYQSMFITTGQGVIVLDAPPSFAPHIREAIASVTKEPIRKLVYSHAHVDHIAGSELFKDIPNLEIIAEKSVSDFLKEMKDPRRLIPTKTFDDKTEIKFGTADVQLVKKKYHSNEGDTWKFQSNPKGEEVDV